MSVCVADMCLVPRRARKGHWIPGTGGTGGLKAAMWCWDSFDRAASALKYWATSVALFSMYSDMFYFPRLCQMNVSLLEIVQLSWYSTSKQDPMHETYYKGSSLTCACVCVWVHMHALTHTYMYVPFHASSSKGRYIIYVQYKNSKFWACYLPFHLLSTSVPGVLLFLFKMTIIGALWRWYMQLALLETLPAIPLSSPVGTGGAGKGMRGGKKEGRVTCNLVILNDR